MRLARDQTTSKWADDSGLAENLFSISMPNVRIVKIQLGNFSNSIMTRIK